MPGISDRAGSTGDSRIMVRGVADRRRSGREWERLGGNPSMHDHEKSRSSNLEQVAAAATEPAVTGLRPRSMRRARIHANARVRFVGSALPPCAYVPMQNRRRANRAALLLVVPTREPSEDSTVDLPARPAHGAVAVPVIIACNGPEGGATS